MTEFNVENERRFKDVGTMTEFTVVVPEVITDGKNVNLSVVGPSNPPIDQLTKSKPYVLSAFIIFIWFILDFVM